MILLLLGCALPCEATVNAEIPTVLEVSFTAPRDGEASVTYADGLTTPVRQVSRGEDVTIPLYGLGPLEDVEYTLTAGGSTCTGSARTDNLPPEFPDITTTGEASFPYIVGSTWSLSGAQSWLYVIDADGRVVWLYPLPAGQSAFQAMPAAHGEGIVFNTLDASRQTDVATIVQMGFDGRVIQTTRTELAHHVFWQGDDGTLAWLALDVRSWTDPETGDVEDVVGDRVVALSPDGVERTVFDTWDALPVTKGPTWNVAFYPLGKDWTHANSVDYDADRGTWLISFHNLRSVVEVDDAPVRLYTAQPYAELGFEQIPVADGALAFDGQHDVEWDQSGHLSMFATDEHGWSGAVGYSVVDGALQQAWAQGFDQSLTSLFLGQVEDLDDQHRFVAYSSKGILQEIGPDGEVVWEARLGVGNFFGDSYPFAGFFADSG